MNARSVILGICCFLVAAVFTIVFLAKQEEHDLFMGGEHVPATVTRVTKGRDRPIVTVSYTAEGKTEEQASEKAGEAQAKLKPGDKVELCLHRNVPFRVALCDAVAAEKPSPLLFIGTALSVLLGVYVMFLPRLQARRRARRTSGLDVITDSLKRTRTSSLAVGGGIAAFAGFMIWLGLSGADKTAGAGTNIAIVVLGALFGFFGVFIALRGFALLNIDKSPILQTIQNSPGEIAWIYEQVVATRGAEAVSATSFVWVWFADGKSYSISVVTEDAKDLLGELSRRAPHALVGYSSENEKRYKANPAAFRP